MFESHHQLHKRVEENSALFCIYSLALRQRFVICPMGNVASGRVFESHHRGPQKESKKRVVLLRTVLKLNRKRYLPTGGQRAICFLSFLLALRRVTNSLLLREKVAAVRLTDEESLLVGTPHPPLSRSPFPHWGRLFCIP